MPRFEPFAGLRYAPAALASHGASLDDVVAPPYDVIDPAGREALVRRSPLNAVRLELPEPEVGKDRYSAAAALLSGWMEAGVLRLDADPAFYLYAMSYTDHAGRSRRTSGVIGALEASPAADGQVLPHEQTMPKPKGDRLDLLRACRANISPVWGLSLAAGLSSCWEPFPAEEPDAVALDIDGVTHECWPITDPAAIGKIASVVGSAAVLLADGHHRYETSIAYREEMRAAARGAAGDYDLVMALVVELAEDQLAVGPIHRILTGLPEGYDLVGALARGFEMQPAPGLSGAFAQGGSMAALLAEAGGPALVTGEGAWYMRARPEVVAAAEDDLDSSRLGLALEGIAGHELSYHHDPAEVVRAVREGGANAGILIRPASVAVIERAGRERRRLPAKSTFFTPKPRTGMVFRLLR
ncbi:MAG: DUF1015 family protein [Acidimicrobiales bacterium]